MIIALYVCFVLFLQFDSFVFGLASSKGYIGIYNMVSLRKIGSKKLVDLPNPSVVVSGDGKYLYL